MAQVAWIPDWFGNNGRTVIQALFQPDCAVNTINYGCYNSPAVDTLISQAEAATSRRPRRGGLAPGRHGHHAERRDRPDAWTRASRCFSSARVPGTRMFTPNIGELDITNLWLANG